MHTRIFINYRRDDTAGVTGRIGDHLRREFGEVAVFQDIEDIPVGTDFVQHIKGALSGSSVMIAVIGQRWGAWRLHDEADFVRLELEMALKAKIPIIPVLVEGASMPERDDVPASLHALLRQQSMKLDVGSEFHSHIRLLIEGIKELQASRPSISEACGRRTLPPEPRVFLGRDRDVAELKARLGVGAAAFAGDDRREPLLVIRGWPGIGKTTLLSAVAHDAEVGAGFRDGVLWAALGKRPALADVLASWGEALGDSKIRTLPSLEEMADRVARMLVRRQVLLLVDDVWDLEHAETMLKASSASCAMVITTREPALTAQLALPERAVVKLEPLQEDDAFALFVRLAPDIAQRHPSEVRSLLSSLECLPLAINVAARLLREEAAFGWGVRELLVELQSGLRIVRAPAPGDLVRSPGDASTTVATLFKKSTDRLDPTTRQHFAALGDLEAKPAVFDLRAIESAFGIDDVRDSVRVLVARGLLEPLNDGWFQMHALLVAHAQSLQV